MKRRNWVALPDSLDLTREVIDASYFPTYDLLTSKGSEQSRWHERAAHLRDDHFGREVFVRAVVEVSNFCRENCSYCGMRRDNKALGRFRARYEQMAELLLHHRPDSVTDVNIQAGEDPVVVREIVLPLIELLRRETSLGISVCLGTLTSRLYAELQAAGATIYILKFESGHPRHYDKVQAPGSYRERIDHIQALAQTGWKVSSGFIAGLPGQGRKELLANFTLARALPLEGCSVSPFIPGDETPFATCPTAGIDLTLNCMAALRLMNPGWVIPAVSALNLADPEAGYRRGLRTGANLVTINLTPAGLRGDYVLYKRNRFIMTEERILDAIAAEGLSPSTQSLAGFFQKRTRAIAPPADAPIAVAAA